MIAIGSISKLYREKYAKKKLKNGVGMTPAGGKDIVELCNIIDRLVNIVRDLQCNINTEQQNAVEQRMWY